eukprot:1253678-Pyramimonas_sp.AAC.1
MAALVGHAPHSRYTATAIDQWWSQMEDANSSRAQPAPLYCLLDANATVGSVQSEHVGPVAPECETLAGL